MARGFIQGYVERGGENVTTDGRVSTTDVQRSFPSATVSVFNAGTVILATIFSTELGVPLPNPFIADTDGHWGFWADQARYDVQFSGAGITSPYSLFNLETVIAAGLVDPGSNGILARIAPNTLAARTILGTTSAITVLFGDGSGNPTLNLDTGLNFAGKTISGGTYIAPGISSFVNALHTHADAIGGGQLNATNVFSAGTVPVARLPLMVGASGIANGVSGLVPQPNIGDQANFLRGDGVWATAGGGGGGTPGGANTTVQYNNAGAFGGVGGATSDGTNITFGSTNLRATRPRFITSIDDTNGNELIGLVSTGSAVNEISITNAATGTGPSITVTGGDPNPNLNISAKGSGIIATVSNFQMTNNAPQIVLIDANDSKTVRISLNGANWAFINDTAGQTPINIDTTSSAVTLAGALTVGGVLNVTGLATFTVIPVGPASNPTTPNQLARKQYVDDSTTAFSIVWFIDDPSTFPIGDDTQLPVFIVPPNTGMVATGIRVIYLGGSHTINTSVSFVHSRRNSVGGAGVVITSVDLNNINNTIRTTYSAGGGGTLTAGDQVTCAISAVVGSPITERKVSIALIGTQKRI